MGFAILTAKVVNYFEMCKKKCQLGRFFLGKGGNGKVKTEKGEFRELRRNRGTEKGSVIFDLSDFYFFGGF